MKWLLLVLAACAHAAGPDDALAAYRTSILAMNVDATVALMAPDVEVAHGDAPPTVGRAQVDTFLRGFAGYHVTAYAIAAATELAGDRATQRGRWSQDVTLPDGTHAHVGGTFVAIWRRAGDRWLLASMHTRN